MKIQTVQVGNRVVSGSLRVVAHQPVELEHHIAPQVSGAKAILAGVTAGTAANYAWSGFQATNTLGMDDLAKLLVKNGLSPEHAPAVSQKVYEVIQAEPTKVLLVAVSAGGTTWAAIEAGSKLLGISVSAWRKLLFSGAVAIAAGLAYHYLRGRGYVQ